MSENHLSGAYNLAIETTGRIGSVALGCGAEVLGVEVFSAALRHAVELLPTIDRLCASSGVAPAEIAEVYVSGGPGSFTGIRIGITVARTLAWAGDIRVVRVPTLDVIAQNALDVAGAPTHLAVFLDAKRNKVYAASFERSGDSYRRTSEPAEHNADAFLDAVPKPVGITGEGVLFVGEIAKRSGVIVLAECTFRARAEVVYRLGYEAARRGCFDDLNTLTPIYVRRPEAEEIWERRHDTTS